ncbi:aminotransferase class I/II-fold pyridoxal phosphate-dependent enzyme [Streptomyces morookaense]|uniref:aminotransferase class I/II-fold pyridoxal phosphate-dependent enzyme n=1 Tax=Streptomyces morookaense TaxID=1970 RepID=UPI0033D5587B
MQHLLMLNENPLPPLPSVAEEITRQVGRVNRYPEFFPDHLKSAIATWLGLPGDQVVVGAGSVGVALQALQAAVRPGRQLVYGWRNFDAYPLLARMAGARPVEVPLLPGGHQDITAIAKAAAADTGAVIICNPHNPTGQRVDADELRELIASVPSDTVVVLDEAYIEFVPAVERPPSVEWTREFPNLLVLRTFSKAYGLAGMRVGYGVASPGLAGRINAFQLPFAMSSLSVAAVEASLKAEDELRERVAFLVSERERVLAGLRSADWAALPSHTNFFWLDEPERVEQVRTRLEAAGVAARHYPGEGVRITVGDRAANDAVLGALTH